MDYHLKCYYFHLMVESTKIQNDMHPVWIIMGQDLCTGCRYKSCGQITDTRKFSQVLANIPCIPPRWSGTLRWISTYGSKAWHSHVPWMSPSRRKKREKHYTLSESAFFAYLCPKSVENSVENSPKHVEIGINKARCTGKWLSLLNLKNESLNENLFWLYAIPKSKWKHICFETYS